MVAYLVVAVGLNLLRYKSLHPNKGELLSQAFDGATFSASWVVLWGVVEPTVLKLIGSTVPFLIIGGVAGLVYSFGALFPKN